MWSNALKRTRGFRGPRSGNNGGKDNEKEKHPLPRRTSGAPSGAPNNCGFHYHETVYHNETFHFHSTNSHLETAVVTAATVVATTAALAVGKKIFDHCMSKPRLTNTISTTNNNEEAEDEANNNEEAEDEAMVALQSPPERNTKPEPERNIG